jgi:hypothetical protein
VRAVTAAARAPESDTAAYQQESPMTIIAIIGGIAAVVTLMGLVSGGKRAK